MAKANNKSSADGNSSAQSVGVKTSSLPGGYKDNVSFPQDNASNMKTKNPTGDKMGGSTTNLSHSLSGSSAVQK
jgi:hypothetical protein